MLRNAISGLVSVRRLDIIERRVPSLEAGGAAEREDGKGMGRSLTSVLTHAVCERLNHSASHPTEIIRLSHDVIFAQVVASLDFDDF